MTSRDVFLGNCKLTFGNVSISGGVHISDFKICRPRFISKFRFISQISKFSDSDSDSNSDSYLRFQNFQTQIHIKISKLSRFPNVRKYLVFPRGSFKLRFGPFLGFSSLKLPLGSFKLRFGFFGILKLPLGKVNSENPKKMSLKLPLGKVKYFLKF